MAIISRFLTIIIFLTTSLTITGSALASHINVIELDNKIISPVTQQYIIQSIDNSSADGAECLVIKLDTPGGLLESTRAIVKSIMNSKVPIVVYVSPSGSRAGSAGVFITLASHVAVMAPSTNIGAAHPVSGEGGGGPIKKFIKRIRPDESNPSGEKAVEELVEEERSPMDDKILNDTVAWVTTIAKARGRNEEWAALSVTESVSVTESKALELGIIDFIATDIQDLLTQLHGRVVNIADTRTTLETENAQIVMMPMQARQLFLASITHPNVAYILMMLGTFGLIFEFTHPGIGFPGIAGLICLLLALYAFQALPVSYVAISLIAIGLILLVAEAQVVSGGLLALGGVIGLTIGSLMLFESPNPDLRVSLSVIIPTVVTISAIILFLLKITLAAFKQPLVTGKQGLIGKVGKALSNISPDGQIFVHGETWSATSNKPIKKGSAVKIIKVRGLNLLVEQHKSINSNRKIRKKKGVA